MSTVDPTAALALLQTQEGEIANVIKHTKDGVQASAKNAEATRKKIVAALTPAPTPPAPPSPNGSNLLPPSSLGTDWKLAFSDYFEGDSVDTSKWVNWDTGHAVVANNCLTLETTALGVDPRLWSDTRLVGDGGYNMAVGDYIEIDAILPGSPAGMPFSWATLWVCTANVSGSAYWEIDITEGGYPSGGSSTGFYQCNYHPGNGNPSTPHTWGAIAGVRHKFGFYRGSSTCIVYLDQAEQFPFTPTDEGTAGGIVLTTGAPSGESSSDPIGYVGAQSNLVVYSVQAWTKS